MKKIIFLLIVFSATSLFSQQQTIKIIETTDVHGHAIPWDFLENKPYEGSLAAVHTFVEKQREKGEVILLDNGDILQGNPFVYYYNFIDKERKHVWAEIMNYMKYNAATVGNHDIEAGHDVYDRFNSEINFPWLAANAINSETGKPYFKPYTIIIKGGVKIAVLGLITPAIPKWLPEYLWKGMYFDDMVKTAEKWIPEILEKEKPDLMVGLFHAGGDYTYGGGSYDEEKNENASMIVAEKVPGFDIIFIGHDHRLWNKFVEGPTGKKVLILGAGSRGKNAAVAEVKFMDGKVESITGDMKEMKDYGPHPGYMEKFAPEIEAVKNYVSEPLGEIADTVWSSQAFFGDSKFMDLVHTFQLNITGAEISFAAPLSFNVSLGGPVTVGDMFKLYRYENMIYTMNLSGAEIDGVLEYAAGLWFETMNSTSTHMLKFRDVEKGRLQNAYYNFESAEGIKYTVDLSKPDGNRVEITTVENGEPFEPESIYRVAVNSYRGSGGGGHLTKGAGINPDELAARISSSSEMDLRYLIMEQIKKMKSVKPAVNNNWKIIPENFYEKGKESDCKILFGK